MFDLGGLRKWIVALETKRLAGPDQQVGVHGLVRAVAGGALAVFDRLMFDLRS